jgi:BirA family transcriptional regulator, biotin operon repressor / biotin---[acetyl-CoA-carboxylase] ligase
VTLPQPIATWRLGRHVGREVRVFDRLDSTSSLALALADDPASAGLAIVARSQSAGRGQYGRTWTAPVGSSVLLSAIVFPPPALRPPAILTSWAAVSVCETLADLGERRGLSPPETRRDCTFPEGISPSARLAGAMIKWPNDVLIAGKKIAGILIEQRTVAGTIAAIVGIGVNVGQSAADFAELPEATSLAIVTGKPFGTDAVCRALIERLDAEYDRLLAGDLTSLGERWQHRLQLVGKPVVAEVFDRAVHGQLVEVGLAAIVLQVDGDLVHLPPESIRQLRLDRTAT